MQIRSIVPLLLALVALAAAWSDQDHEIFRLRDEAIKLQGQNATFYSVLGLKPSASIQEIRNAYRKLSRTQHPDKARSLWLANYDKQDPAKAKTGDTPGVKVQKHKKPSQREVNAFNKKATAQWKTITLIHDILKSEVRPTYDHFLRNGFPLWRGTDYYYHRYRPGLGSVLVGLFLFIGGGMHYLVLWLNWRNHREFVGRYIKHARRTAWGDTAVPALANVGTATPESDEEEQAQVWNRRERRLRDKERAKDKKAPRPAKKEISAPMDPRVTSGPTGAKKRTVAENGKVLIVDSVGNVFLEEETEDGEVHELLLDVDEIQRPVVTDTVVFQLPLWAYNRTVGKWTGNQTLDAEIADLVGPEKDVGPDEAALRSALPANASGEARRRRTKNKPRA